MTRQNGEDNNGHDQGSGRKWRTVSAPDMRSNVAPATVLQTSSVTPCLSAGLPLSKDMFRVRVYLQAAGQG